MSRSNPSPTTLPTEKSPRYWLLIDQVVSSGSNSVLVLLAARNLRTGDFAIFATVQLVSVVLMGVGRASIYGPALSTQRTRGKLRIPVSWVAPVALILTFLGAPLVAWIAMPARDIGPAEVLIISVIPSLAFLQDGLRYARLSESRVKWVLSSDLAWLAISVPLVAIVGDSLLFASVSWAAGAAAGIVILAPQKPLNLAKASLKHTWAIGRWGLIDSALTGLVVAGPTVATTALLDPSLVATYRVTQAAVSPMNVVNSVLVVSFGLSAWKLGNLNARSYLHRQVSRATVALGCLALALVFLGIPISLWFADRELSSSVQAWVVVGSVTAVGAWMSARQAAAQALGMQRTGAVTRMVSATFAVTVIAVASTGRGNISDPIGLTLLGSTAISFFGCQFAFSRGLRTLATAH